MMLTHRIRTWSSRHPVLHRSRPLEEMQYIGLRQLKDGLSRWMGMRIVKISDVGVDEVGFKVQGMKLGEARKSARLVRVVLFARWLSEAA